MTVLTFPSASTVSAKLTVTSYYPGPIGGGLLIGTDEAGASRRVAIRDSLLPRAPVKGEVWRITGGHRYSTKHACPYVEADVALPMPLEGEAIVRYLADSPEFPGVGHRTALRLRNGLGLAGLYAALKNRDYEKLATVVDPQIAVKIVNAAGLLHEEIETLGELERLGIDAKTAGIAFSVWGRGAAAKLECQPYALRLLLPWRKVDVRALRMGVDPTDERRLLALVEEAFSTRLQAGHTACTREEVAAVFSRHAGATVSARASSAINAAIEQSRVMIHRDGLLQSRASWWMEREVERLLLSRLEPTTSNRDEGAADLALAETTATIGWPLKGRQVDAVHMAVRNRICVLAGGAGTGKTTTLNAIVRAVGHKHSIASANGLSPGLIVQVAVAGRAARRITQATGAPAVTLARFIRDLEGGLVENLSGGLVIADEASMLDLPQVYRMLTLLPDDTNLLFVGDAAQLPPIGPGQVFRTMFSGSRIPKVELDLVHRQDASGGIPAIAQSIRDGRLPDLPEFDPSKPLQPGVFVLPSKPAREKVASAAFEAFGTMAGPVPVRGAMSALHAKDIQVLCPTINGAAGTKAMNSRIDDVYVSRQQRAKGWALSVGSKVIWLKNDYRKAPVREEDGSVKLDPKTGEPRFAGLMNGSIGIVHRHSDTVSMEDPKPGTWVDFDDGSGDWIFEEDLRNLTFGWAITVHKAQGSAFQRVIFPSTRNRMLDRSMVYTAVTRAVQTCVLVGDIGFLREVVSAEPRAFGRRTCLSL